MSMAAQSVSACAFNFSFGKPPPPLIITLKVIHDLGESFGKNRKILTK